jgi:hypothetical protein
VREPVEPKRKALEEKIGEGLVRVGAMTDDQVETVLTKQRRGDNRLFGEIAIELGYVKVNSLIDYLTEIEED